VQFLLFTITKLLDCTGTLNPRMTIDALPDDLLLEVFSLCVHNEEADEDEWQMLVHICHRWRCLVFASPRRLNLRLLCTQNVQSKLCWMSGRSFLLS
jgi:hypothetical protein